MRKTVIFILLSVLSLSVSSCDFFRVLAGRPTSARIAEKRSAIEREQAEHRERLDSLKAEEKSIADSVAAAVAAAMAASEDIRHSKDLLSLAFKYHIVIGTFSNRQNAGKLAATAEAAGYEAELISYSNGFTAVSAFAGNDLVEVVRILGKIREESFCPKDAWILESD